MKGITVKLHQRVKIGTDELGAPIYDETVVDVDNILVGIPTTQEILDTTQIDGKRLAYTLAIPKGDKHQWSDAIVEFWNIKFHTIGAVTQGIEHLIPLSWNKKVMVEVYGKD